MLLNRIELFVAVAVHRNLGKTARQMHVSASSICQRLKSLERDFGAKLYKRSKEGIELTDAGQRLLSTGNDIISQLDTLRTKFNPASRIAVRSLTVGGTYNPSAKYLPLAIAAFRKRYPQIEVTFLTAVKSTIEKWLREFKVEIAVIQTPPDAPDLQKEHFAVDEIVLFIHPTHPLAKRKGLGLEELAKTPLIIKEGTGTSHKVLHHLKQKGLKTNVALRCATPDGIKGAVQRKLGLGILFQSQVEEEVKKKDFKILKFSDLPTFVGHSYIVYNKSNALSSAANDFLSVLRSMKARIKNPVKGSESKAA